MDFEIAIIGAGPGGYCAALRAAQLGFRVVCIDKRDVLGGTCLQEGCIPSKVLLQISQKYHSLKHYEELGIVVKSPKIEIAISMQYKEHVVHQLSSGIKTLFDAGKITFISDTATFQDAHTLQLTSGNTVSADTIIIATGSAPVALPMLPFDEQQVLSSTGVLDLHDIPESLAIIGGGVIGLELGSVWQRLGTKVTVIEAQERLCMNFDTDIMRVLQKTLEDDGMKILTRAQVKGAEVKRKGVELQWMLDGKDNTQMFEKVMVAVGRKPYTEGLNLSAVGITCDERGRIPVNHDNQTAVPHIYAVGDVTVGPMLAHKASEEGVNLVERLKGHKVWMNPDVIPEVMYTHPEVASVGQNEQRLKADNIPYKVGKFSLGANARAKANHDAVGFVKILTDPDTDLILGGSVVGADAGTLIGEIAFAIEMAASAEDIARTCHAHPTVNEALKEAALSAFDRALHGG